MAALRCHVTLKLATSLDGQIATASGESRWITGAAAREETHRLRAASDVVVVGSGTALADDPELTVRLPGYTGTQPARLVVDGRLRLPLASRLVETAAVSPMIVACAEPADPSRVDALVQAGVEVWQLPPAAGGRGVALNRLLEACAGKGLSNVMVEGGGDLAASLILSDLVDRIVWFRAPLLLGGDGRPAISDLALSRLADAPRFVRTGLAELGDDVMEVYETRRADAGGGGQD